MEQKPEAKSCDAVDLQTNSGFNALSQRIENFQNVVYPQIFKFRKEQLARGVDISSLTYTQLGLQNLEKCHHISNTQTIKDGIPSFRVRVCKTCCQSDGHIELGTYVDQESAIIVNDTHEILQNRFSKLACLRPDDKQYLKLLTARKFDRHHGEEIVSVLDILEERNSIISRSRSKNLLKYRRNTISLTSSIETDSFSESDNKSNYSNSDESLLDSHSQTIKDAQNLKISPNNNDNIFNRIATEISPNVSQFSNSNRSSFETDDIYAAHVLTTLSFSGSSGGGGGSSQNSPPPTLMNAMLSNSTNSNNNSTLTFRWKRKHETSSMTFPNENEDEINDVANTLTSLPLAFTYEAIMNSANTAAAVSSDNNTSNSLIISVPSSNTTIGNNHNKNITMQASYSQRARSNSTSMLNYQYHTNINNNININSNSNNRRLRADTIADVHDESLNYSYNGRNPATAIGCYSPNSRKKRIEKFQEKRKHRVWTKKVKYDVRKNFADSRVRIKGRFVKKSEEYLANSGSTGTTSSGTSIYHENNNTTDSEIPSSTTTFTTTSTNVIFKKEENEDE